MKIIVKIKKDASGYYRAWCPALPGCFSYGPSQELAVEKLNEAVTSYLASLDAVTQTVETEVLVMTA